MRDVFLLTSRLGWSFISEGGTANLAVQPGNLPGVFPSPKSAPGQRAPSHPRPHWGRGLAGEGEPNWAQIFFHLCAISTPFTPVTSCKNICFLFLFVQPLSSVSLCASPIPHAGRLCVEKHYLPHAPLRLTQFMFPDPHHPPSQPPQRPVHHPVPPTRFADSFFRQNARLFTGRFA